MKIDRAKLKKSSSEVPPDCKLLVEKIRGSNEKELLELLKNIKTWNYGKCELYHWIDVLDLFDSILAKCCHKERDTQWTLPVDLPNNSLKELCIPILQFTALLIEHSFSKHVYNSMEHLTTLLSSSDMQIVLSVLNLLYVFSKRSNFITRSSPDRRKALLTRLNYLAESWGGKENGFGLADCCQDFKMSFYPPSATTLHFEYYCDESGSLCTTGNKKSSSSLNTIHKDNVDQIKDKTIAQVMEELLETHNVPKEKQMLLFTHLRLAHNFSNYRKRLQCVQARLQALSIIVHSNAMSMFDNSNNILYNGFIEELVDVLELDEPKLLDIKAAALRTLTSVIHLDHTTQLNTIIDATGAASYHGFLPTLVRSCIQALIDDNTTLFPLSLATALFSFLYHLASYENGGEALVSCGMIESLLKVVSWTGSDPEHITFVTRAVRVIDLITNLDMNAFQNHGGLSVLINRLEYEVDICRKECPFEIDAGNNRRESQDGILTDPSQSLIDPASSEKPSGSNTMEIDNGKSGQNISTMSYNRDLQIYPQRAAVLKSMFNFLKKAIQDSSFSDSIRHLMDGPLPKCLRHIISNAEYYGPYLFMLATDVVTVYVFQEPSLLSSLQESGLTDVVLQALLVKEIPATREVIASLPNVFSALCLNTRGLEAFTPLKPFEKIFKLLLSPDYLPAMRRRRSNDPMVDTASNLGSAMDELMRHQPSLRAEATSAIIKLLKQLCELGSDPNFVCSKPAAKGPESNPGQNDSIRPVMPGGSAEAGSSDEEDEEDEETTTAAPPGSLIPTKPVQELASTSSAPPNNNKQPVPLVDYILHVMRLIDAILSNNSTDDHCREFVKQKGLEPLLNILRLPNLPIDFPLTPACLAVSSVCKSLQVLTYEREVLKLGLTNLNEVLISLKPLHQPLPAPGGSVLLEELVQATSKAQGTGCDPLQSASLTPLLHHMSAAHAYIIMFVHVCRTGQPEIRNLTVTHWGSDIGLNVLRGLSQLYTSLVWESTVLLALCSDSTATATWKFGRHQVEKLASLTKEGDASPTGRNYDENKMEIEESCDGLNGDAESSKKKDAKSKTGPQMKQIKPLLSSASRLGRALAELFGLLVKLCVNSPLRHRRNHHSIPSIPVAPFPAARSVATHLTKLLAKGLSWTPPPTSPIPKFRLTFYTCSVGFTSPMLFDERKFPYHLMLQKFVQCGGQDAFFDTFHWALTQGGKVPIEEGLEHPNVPDGTGEFLDSWLMLLEKMVNPKMVLESPHTMVTKTTQPNFVPFDPVEYLIKTHKKAFECVMHLWNKKPLKVYGERMSESVLAIFCHLLKGETIIQEKLSKEKEPEVKESTSAPMPTVTVRATRRNELEEQGISTEHLQQLMDMGFARELALEALVHANSLEQATDYLLSHPSLTRSGGTDWEMSEEDQMIRAIAMSLDENATPEGSAEGTSKETPEKESEPMSKEVIDEFTNELLVGCLKLLDTLPETVYRVCDLLLAVCHRNGEKWTEQMFKQLISAISSNIDKLLESAQPMTSSDKRSISEWASQISSLPEAFKAATRIHLFSLLFEEKRNQCAALISETNLINNLVQLLESAQNALLLISSNKSIPLSTPKWLSPAILLIDLYDKSAIASARKAPLLALSRRQWKWFDDRSGKWTMYTLNNNKTIDDAYKNGESFVRFTASRRKYTVQFSTMVQINEETGNWRPIMFICDDKAMEVTEESTSSSKPSTNYIIVKGLEPYQCTALVRACTGFIGIPVDPDTLHAVMRLVLRLTRNYEQAAIFEELGGVRSILSLTQSSAFTGFTSLATLIIRHVMEDPNTLRYTMERVIRATLHNPTINCKEMHYILRVLGPAACRNKDLFLEITKSILRISLYPQSKREEDDTRMLSAQAVQTLRLLPTKQPNAVNLQNNIIKEVIYDLLNALTVKTNGCIQDDLSISIEKSTSTGTVSYCPVLARGIARESSSSDLVQQDDDEIATSEEATPADCKSTAAKDEESAKKSRPLLNQSCIMRLLAELIRSYPLVAKLIAEHVYPAGHNDLITEECTALSFILDHLLPNTQNVGDKNCPALTRVLIAALSSSNHCPDAQTTLVNEVKSALYRALALPESNEKHVRVQAILGIINTMIDSCPAVAQTPPPQTIQGSFRGQPAGLNNMVKIMLRRGIVNDLARITHSLDFSSPHMALTVNAALKPLETLSKIINLPTSIFTQAKRPKAGNVSSSNTEAMEEDAVNSGSTGPANNLVNETNEEAATETTGNVEPEIYDLNSSEITDQQRNTRTYDAVEDNADNEAVVIEESIHFDVYNDSHSRSSNLIDEVIRNEHDNAAMEPEENHDNVINSNGAESESDDESDSDEEDEDDDDDDQSNPDEEERDEEDEDEDEDDHVDDDDVEDDEISAYVNQEDIDDSVLRNYDRDSEHLVFDIEDMIPASVFTEGSLRLTTILPMLENEQLSNTADATQPSVPPAPGSVSISHPLLVRPGEIGDSVGMNPASASTTASILASRPHRSNRQRMYRPPVSSSTGAAHPNWTSGIANRHPNPPVILQRLLGPSTAQQILQLTSDWLDFSDSGLVAGAGSSSVLGSIPSAMLRWTEESRVLDGESMHDCVAQLKMSIIEVWEKYRDEELAERKEKRKNMLEEEEKPKKKMARDKGEKNGSKESESRPQTESTVYAHTERLAASIVEQVLGPVMASTNLTGSSDSQQQADDTESSQTISRSEDQPPTDDGNEREGESRAPETEADIEAQAETETETEAEAEVEAEVEARAEAETEAEGEGEGEVETEAEAEAEPDDDDQPSSLSPSNDTTSVQNDNEITEMICSLSTREEENPRPMDIDESRRQRNPCPSRDDPPPPPERASSSDGLVATGAITPEDLSTANNSSSECNAAPTISETTTQSELRGNSALQAPEPGNTVEVANGGANANASTSTNNSQPVGSSSASSNDNSVLQNLLGDTELPEGVDPSFLAALPENIRQEVIAEQLRLQRLQQQRNTATTATAGQPSGSQPAAQPATGENSALSEVNPEFLAALPPNIQEEVLAQQRAEQQRLQAQTTSPDAPVDPAVFIQTLPPGLRRQVLADMDDSLLALLPLDLASEAQNLRQELEARHRQFSERFLASHATTTLSRILRSASGRTRYAISTAQGGNWLWDLGARGTNPSNYSTSSGHPHQARPPFPPGRFKGKQLLDHEALCCLLILLFVDEPKLNVCRLQRVLKNLCHHNATRIWVVNSLLAIMEKTRDTKEFVEQKPRKSSSSGSILSNKSSNQSPSWLSISLDAALGCRTNVFQIIKGGSGKKGAGQSSHSIIIHPQAAPLVCRHVLDTLISLAKNFTHPLRPESLKEEQKLSQSSQSSDQCNKSCKDPDFWEVLLRLDSSNSTKKGKSVIKSHGSSPFQSNNPTCANESESTSQENETSPLVQIINLLSHPVVKRSSLLTDKLLRLLSSVAISLTPNDGSQSYFAPSSQPTEQGGSSHENSSDKSKVKTENTSDKKLVINEDAIKLAVEVLTSKSCSEAGLEDATSLLLRLSRSCPATRDIVLNLLLEGARELGFTVSQHITKLNEELSKLNISSKEPSDDNNAESNADKILKGIIQDRFTSASIVINAATHIKHTSASKEVQLPSMAALTSKTSSQSFFLRILKVIVQLRESIRMHKIRCRLTSSTGFTQTSSETPNTSSATTEGASSEIQEADVDGQESLSSKLNLHTLWECLSNCLLELADAPDHHAVLVLQPAVEAFFLVHASEKEPKRRRENRHESRETQLAHVNQDLSALSPMVESNSTDANATVSNLPVDTQKFLQFAETHKVVLNQILRQSTTPLANGPFSVLVDHTRVLDFDVKRRYFRQELERMENGARREDLPVHVRREHVFEDSFRELYRRTTEEWKNRFYIVFEGEEGQDAGGLLREWYTIISREIFNPMYALFTTSPGDRVTYMINSASHCNSNHLQYFKFVGRVIAKAIYDNKLLECYFTRSFYKHILGKLVNYHDMESEDYSFYRSLVFLLEHDVKELDIEQTFSLEVQEFGVTEIRDLKPNGRNIEVTEENKHEYVRLVCQEKMTGSIRKQLSSFLEGFYEIIPKRLISIFNEQELELLISGLPNIDIDDLKANCEYHKYQANSLQIQWFWRALRSFDQADRAKFLQFVTGTSKVPLQGFSALEGMNGTQRFQIHRDDRSTDRLPSAHTCFNQLDLPAYETYDKLKTMMLKAIHECSEGFGFA
ncbi:E3 ubiquitin-protein ligase HUWE1 isoform X3 [Tetranychus urticae]|uniref:E3 ubiquitin-protein ligase HUWE1 isoform X3 n=1 Tax=Tetranychus urticae TaxID=32264 RepID=UPI00077C035C|nr:E3 ubiquitin-protein ligase HUWE1 isoform X3 [Tetranychus urticae]